MITAGTFNAAIEESFFCLATTESSKGQCDAAKGQTDR
jgi:hypothetical protein